jgi:hypothetical protein
MRSHVLSLLLLAGCASGANVKELYFKIGNVEIDSSGMSARDNYVYPGIESKFVVYSLLCEYDRLMVKDGFVLKGTNHEGRIWASAGCSSLSAEELKRRDVFEGVLNEFFNILKKKNL